MSLTVRNLGRHSDGYWTAEVAAENGLYVNVHRKCGSWMSGHGELMKGVLPAVAAKLQEQTIKAERRERR